MGVVGDARLRGHEGREKRAMKRLGEVPISRRGKDQRLSLTSFRHFRAGWEGSSIFYDPSWQIFL